MNPETSPDTLAPVTGELDAKGTPYDPAKHLPKKNRFSGRWMPRGGRKKNPVPTAPESPATGEPSAPITPPETPAPSPADAAPAFAELDRAAGPATPPPSADPQAKPAAVEVVEADATLSPEDTGEMAARAVYAVVGAVIGDHKAATAAGPEHANIRRVAAAYCRARGFAVVGTLALVGTFLAYLLGENRREAVTEKIKGFLSGIWKEKTARPVQPVATPTPRAPSPAPEERPEGFPARPPGVPPLAPVTLPVSS